MLFHVTPGYFWWAFSPVWRCKEEWRARAKMYVHVILKQNLVRLHFFRFTMFIFADVCLCAFFVFHFHLCQSHNHVKFQFCFVLFCNKMYPWVFVHTFVHNSIFFLLLRIIEKFDSTNIGEWVEFRFCIIRPIDLFINIITAITCLMLMLMLCVCVDFSTHVLVVCSAYEFGCESNKLLVGAYSFTLSRSV